MDHNFTIHKGTKNFDRTRSIDRSSGHNRGVVASPFWIAFCDPTLPSLTLLLLPHRSNNISNHCSTRLTAKERV